MKKRSRSIINLTYRYGVLCLGLFLYAIAFNIFMLPNDFVVGGVTGISIILYKLFNLDTSLTVLVLSVLLIIIGFIFCDKERMYSSVASSFILPFFIKLTSNINNYIKVDTSTLVSALFCSLLLGVALGIVFKVGFSTGGTEIIYWILDKFIKKSTGQLMIIVEGVIVLMGAVSFGFQKLMYSLIILYLMSNISDRIVIGISDSKLIRIIPHDYEKIKEYLTSIPFIKFVSLSLEEGKKIIYCIVPTKDYKSLYDSIRTIDDRAFLSVANTYETRGGLKYEKKENF